MDLNYHFTNDFSSSLHFCVTPTPDFYFLKASIRGLASTFWSSVTCITTNVFSLPPLPGYFVGLCLDEKRFRFFLSLEVDFLRAHLFRPFLKSVGLYSGASPNAFGTGIL